jgi:hypothetical protein
MAYALKFPADVTDIIYDMRDHNAWHMTRAREKTPSAGCLNFKKSEDFDEAVNELPVVIVRHMPRHRDVHPFEMYSEDLDAETIEYIDSRGWDRPEPVLQVRQAKWMWVKRVYFMNHIPPVCLRELTLRVCSHLQYKRVSRFARERAKRALKEMWFQCEPCGDF